MFSQFILSPTVKSPGRGTRSESETPSVVGNENYSHFYKSSSVEERPKKIAKRSEKSILKNDVESQAPSVVGNENF